MKEGLERLDGSMIPSIKEQVNSKGTYDYASTAKSFAIQLHLKHPPFWTWLQMSNEEKKEMVRENSAMNDSCIVLLFMFGWELACVDSTKESEKKRVMGVAQRSATMQEPKEIKREEKKESQEIQKNKEALKKPTQEPHLFAVDFRGASAKVTV